MSSIPTACPASASEAVITRVANREDVGPTDLTPLYEVVDPEALDALFEAPPGDCSDVQVEFSYHGYEVTVTGEGVVHIDEAKASPRASV